MLYAVYKMKHLTENSINFLKNLSGTDKIGPDSDIFNDIGMVGDDFHEMIQKYSKKFSVNMSDYLWYFHADEEGGWNSIGALFFNPPYKRVKRIPVTPSMLTDFANQGKWDIQYPDHKLPKRRYDLLINTVLFGIGMLLLIVWMLNKFFAR